MATYREILKWSNNPRLPFVKGLLLPESFIAKGACRGMFEHEARDYVNYLEKQIEQFKKQEEK